MSTLSPTSPPVLGLTGSYGSGKSTVARMLAAAGGFLIDADAISRELTAPGGAALPAIRAAFGDGVFVPDGTLDRKALGALIFSAPEKRAILEGILHPRVREQEVALLEAARSDGRYPFVVLDVPLLFETGVDALCHATCVVSVNEQVREARLLRRDGATPEQVRARLAAQLPQEEKSRRATFVVENSGSLEDTQRQVEHMLEVIRRTPNAQRTP